MKMKKGQCLFQKYHDSRCNLKEMVDTLLESYGKTWLRDLLPLTRLSHVDCNRVRSYLDKIGG